jgi:carbonic anhydrase/acetyltransferase-like protein (isoleucine patch superfamily)
MSRRSGGISPSTTPDTAITNTHGRFQLLQRVLHVVDQPLCVGRGAAAGDDAEVHASLLVTRVMFMAMPSVTMDSG